MNGLFLGSFRHVFWVLFLLHDIYLLFKCLNEVRILCFYFCLGHCSSFQLSLSLRLCFGLDLCCGKKLWLYKCCQLTLSTYRSLIFHTKLKESIIFRLIACGWKHIVVNDFPAIAKFLGVIKSLLVCIVKFDFWCKFFDRNVGVLLISLKLLYKRNFLFNFCSLWNGVSTHFTIYVLHEIAVKRVLTSLSLLFLINLVSFNLIGNLSDSSIIIFLMVIQVIIKLTLIKKSSQSVLLLRRGRHFQDFD